ncbi:MAG: cytochrome d ubiquinol oxidase subunit II [Burkholderiaceae bacterium]
MPLYDWLPIAFMALMGLSALIYVVLDGFDLGVGLLSPAAGREDRSLMIASIGPFWDANETWLVLAVGLLLVAFPVAHGVILTSLYLPATIMLIALILRGVAFEFRAKGPARHQAAWDRVFFAGSLLAALSQGYMLGLYVLGLQTGLAAILFACLVALCMAAAYGMIGATWLIAKTTGALQLQAIGWSRKLLVGTALGMLAISIATPLVNERVFEAWFTLPYMLLLAPIPVMTVGVFAGLYWLLDHLHDTNDKFRWLPFIASTTLFVLAFVGLAYSFFPYVVPDQITIWEAAAARDSLMIILVGTIVTLPVIIGYTIFAYRVFGGKAQVLTYG